MTDAEIIKRLTNEVAQLRGALAWAMGAIDEYELEIEGSLSDEDLSAGYANALELVEDVTARGFVETSAVDEEEDTYPTKMFIDSSKEEE
jgi:hypothetical protein